MAFEDDAPSNPEVARAKTAARKALDANIERRARTAHLVTGGKRPRLLDLLEKRNADTDASRGIPTTDPLSAKSGDFPNRAWINVASFLMHYPSGLVVPYNSGSVAPLRDATRYFVYFDDPTLAGGARTYMVTEKKHETVAKAGRVPLGEVTTPVFGSRNFNRAARKGRPRDKRMQDRKRKIRLVSLRKVTGEGYCTALDAEGLETPRRWQDEGCPKKYVAAYQHPDLIQRKKWQKRIQDEKSKTTRTPA
jgi:hypothetical protein